MAGDAQVTVSSEPDRVTLWSRVGSLFWLKLVGSTVAIAVFFVAYFYVLNHPVFEVRQMPLLAVDRWMPVVDWSAWIYFSLWLYICIPTSLMYRPNQLAYYLMGAACLSVLGLTIFYLFPTAVPSWGIDWSQYETLLFLKESDAAGNACPSLHVAFAVYAGLWLVRLLRWLSAGPRWQAVNLLWCLLIVLSTMTTKQHVWIDVICGAVLGSFVFWLNGVIARKAKFAAYASFRLSQDT